MDTRTAHSGSQRASATGARRATLAGGWLALTILLSGAAIAAQSPTEPGPNFSEPIDRLEHTLAVAPFSIVAAQVSRPNVRGDIALRAEISFDGAAPMRVKLRMATPGADRFNNEPRYDLAAYRLQALFLDADEYVVPPTALRFVPLEEFRRYERSAQRTFIGADEVLAVIQYWLQDVKIVEDVYSPELYAADPAYARHVEQLNVFTWLINHGDSNTGNFLVSRAAPGPRVFAVDNGIAFASAGGDRGRPWNGIRVGRLPTDLVQRLRRLARTDLDSTLGVVAQWRLEEGHFRPVPPGANLQSQRGVRRDGANLQMGLTVEEIDDVWQRLQRLLKMVDDARLATYGPPLAATGDPQP